MALLGLIIGYFLGMGSTLAIACCVISEDRGDDL